MTDLGDLLGLPPARPAYRPRARCADPTCGRLVFVDQLVFGFGWCCAAKRGLIVHRYRLPATIQTGATLFDHLPEEIPVLDPYPQVRIDVTGLTPVDAHRKIVEHARSMITDAARAAVVFPPGVLEAVNDQWSGVIAVLERHAPDDVPGRGIYCGDQPHLERLTRWPCDDYRDVSRGLATGLPGTAAQ